MRNLTYFLIGLYRIRRTARLRKEQNVRNAKTVSLRKSEIGK